MASVPLEYIDFLFYLLSQNGEISHIDEEDILGQQNVCVYFYFFEYMKTSVFLKFFSNHTKVTGIFACETVHETVEE